MPTALCWRLHGYVAVAGCSLLPASRRARHQAPHALPWQQPCEGAHHELLASSLQLNSKAAVPKEGICLFTSCSTQG